MVIVMASKKMAPINLLSIDQFFGNFGRTINPPTIAPKPTEPTKNPKPVESSPNICRDKRGNNAISALLGIANTMSRTNNACTNGE